MNQPRSIDRAPDGGLVVMWDDGHRSEYPPGDLRLACRCAHCEDEWTGRRRLTAGEVPADIRILETRPVGRYGLQFVWSDGHGTGIYTFRHLRELCRCTICRKNPGA